MTEEKKEAKPTKGVSRREFIAGTVGGLVVGAAVGATVGSLEFPTVPASISQPWLPAKWDYGADVVVVGYGGAGLGAAIAATDAGSKVLVLEKAPAGLPSYGNSGVCLGGSVILQPTADYATFFKLQSWGTVTDDALCTATASAMEGNEAWLTSLGCPLVSIDAPVTTSAVVLPEALLNGINFSSAFSLLKGNKYHVFEFKMPDGTAGHGRDLWTFLNGVANSKKIQVLFSTPMTGLVQNPVTKEILGVKARTGVSFASPPSYSYTGGTEVYVKAAKGVVLACGGYENSPEMTLNFLPNAKSNFVTPMGSPYNTGDGIGIAASVGAKLWHMTSGETYELAIKPASAQMGNAVMATEVNSSPLSLQMILVNRYGQRFMNEALYWTHTKKSLAVNSFKDDVLPTDSDDYCDYPNIPFWMIVDDARVKAGILGMASYGQTGYSAMCGWLGTHNVYQWSSDNSAEIAKGWIVKADTIQALGSLLKTQDVFGRPISMDANALATTVANYNKYCAAGNDPDFARNPKTMTPIQTAPFYAMEMCVAMLNTNGGPVRNQYMQTTDINGNVIPRLYSAGEFGSIFGFLYYGGGNLPEALGTGRVAGQNAAKETPWS